MAQKYENAENIGKMVSEDKISGLSKKVNATERKLTDIIKKLTDMESAAQAAKKAQRALEAAEAEKKQGEPEQPAAEPEAKQPPKTEEKPAAEVKPAEAPAEKVEKKEPEAVKAEAKPAEAKPEEKKPEEAKAQAPVKEAKKPEEKKAEAPAGDKPAPAKDKKPDNPAQKPAEGKADNQKGPKAEPQKAKPAEPPKPTFKSPVIRHIDPPVRPAPTKPQKKSGENKTFVNKDNRPPRGDKNRPAQGQGNNRPTQNGRPSLRPAPAPAAIPAKPNKNFGPDKKKGAFERTYVEKEKRPMNKRSLQKQQGASVSDFDEDRSVYRKQRKKGAAKQTTQFIKIEHAIVTSDNIPIKVLSEKLGISAVEITKRLFKDGITTTVNGSIDYETAFMIAADLGIELEYKPEKTAEEILTEKQADTVEEIESLVPRAPVVTVMGHVDHGKTSLLDYIRKSNVTEGEAGGITQHIGAYTVTAAGKKITFIDTPGHEAFTAMRARGAQVTDIVILVVAADDGIMPQTVEAINHAKAADVSIIVAVNKMDKVGADLNKVKQDLTNYGLVPEEWGGDTIVCPVSAKTGEGVDALLENVLLVAEMKELLANPAREARGAIIEAKLDKGMGPMASVLIQNGTLHTGDNIISGTITGRVRAMIDDKGKQVKEAGPSTAVSVLGFEEVPNAGDSIFAVSQELVKQVAEERKRKESEARAAQTSKVSLDDIFGKISEGNMKNLNLIIKGDVQGSVEAVKQSVLKLSNEEVTVKVIHSGAGAVTETDVMLADSSNAIILAFNVRPDSKAKALAERSKVDIRTYRIIYDLLDDMQAALKGMLTPKYQEVYIGKCEVRQTFKITGVGNIAGCYVLDGKIIRGGKLRIYRENVLIVEGNVQQLKRFKDDVKEVNYGFECGCAIEGFNDIKIGDIIECYMIQEIKQ
ncbi:MAG: translation initiation factor IF-2 [Clostridia bacterium]|nr:translation initiation factor IF-2 [Clostridia bacterium]